MDKILDQAEWITDPVIRYLLAELHPDGYVQICQPLSGSRKNPNINTVYKICYLNKYERPTQDLIVKVGNKKSIEKEFDNYSKFVNQGYLPSEYKVDLFNPHSHNDKSILLIDLVNLDNYKVFTNYYKENPIEVLVTLLEKVLKPWHDNGNPKFFDLKLYIVSRLLRKKDKLNQECERLFPNFVNSCQYYVQQLKRGLTNPVFLLEKEKLALKKDDEFWTIESIVHGDLNFNNIFVEDEKHIKLIDYEYTGMDIVFNDLARLECEIKFTSLKNYENPIFWQGLLEFEEYITNQLLISENELSDNAKEFEEIKKAAKCIAIIRKRVHEIINQSDRIKENAYWIELLIRTLKYVSYKPEDGITDSQKKYAIISSFLLADEYLEGCETEIEQTTPITIFSGPQLKVDSLLIEEEKQGQENLYQLQRALLAGNTMLFLGPDAPQATKAPTKSELAEKLFIKYTGNEPKLKKPDMIFSLLLKSQDIIPSLNEEIYTTYNSIELQGFYRFIPRIRWKRIFNQYVDFLVERSYEELEIESQEQRYENRFSPRESRNDEDSDTVIIERPYGSARFYNDPNRLMQLSAESIAGRKVLRDQWYDLIRDIRAPISILFYGFNWDDLEELYFDIIERVNLVDENANFFWISEKFQDDDATEANIMGLKLIQDSFEKLLNEIKYLDDKILKDEVGKGINISLINKNIFIENQIAENYSKYFEIIHDEIEKNPELDIGPFFQGEEINWYELSANCDVKRGQIQNPPLENKIEKEIKKIGNNKGILLLGKYAGSGTTTIMKRLGFNIAKKKICPVIYLHRLDTNTWKIIEDFYQYCDKKKFLILIDNTSPQSDKLQELYGLLQSRRINNIILATARKDEWNQVMGSYIQSSEDIDINEDDKSNIKGFNWLTVKIVDDILTLREKELIIKKYLDFGILTEQAASRFGIGHSDNDLKYSNLLPLCWAATEGKNRKFELVIKEYYNEKITLSERRIVDVVCAVNFFYSKGITDRMLHRIIKVNWDRLKLLLNSDSMQQLIMIKQDYYEEKRVIRIVPRNYANSEILLQPDSYEFPQKILTLLTENLSVREGEVVEEDLLFNIVRNKKLHKYLEDKSNKAELFEFANNQLPNDTRILQHWGIMLYDHAKEQGKFGNLDDPAWEESIEKFEQALRIEPFNSTILHSLGMANMIRASLFWDKYWRNRSDKSSYDLADIYYRDAIKYFQRSIIENPRVEHAYNTIARILLKRLTDLKRGGKIEEFEKLMAEVRELLDECNQMVPNHKHVKLKHRVADWNKMRGNISKAKGQYRELLESHPKNYSVSYLLSTLLMEENNINSLEEAENVIKKALEEGIRSKGFYKLRYRIAERLYPFDYPKLETLLKGLIEIYPEDPYLVFKYAVICFKNENYSLANQYFRISEKLRFADPQRFDLSDYIWKETDDLGKIIQIWEEKYNPPLMKIFAGNIQTINDSKGYVMMDKTGEELYFNPLRISKDKSFEEGQRIKFNIAFTYVGPKAINPDYV